MLHVLSLAESCAVDNNFISCVLLKHVTVLVPVAWTSPYSINTINKNISSFIYDILDFNMNFIENVDFQVFLLPFYSSFGDNM